MRLSVGTLRQVVKRDLRIAFVPQQLTPYGGLELVRRYLRRIDLPRRLHVACATLGGDYGGARLALLLLALPYVGARRLEHLQYHNIEVFPLEWDPGRDGITHTGTGDLS